MKQGLRFLATLGAMSAALIVTFVAMTLVTLLWTTATPHWMLLIVICAFFVALLCRRFGGGVLTTIFGVVLPVIVATAVADIASANAADLSARQRLESYLVATALPTLAAAAAVGLARLWKR